MIRRGVLVAAVVLVGAVWATWSVLGRSQVVEGNLVLSRTDGWRPGIDAGRFPYAVVEVAYDAATARRLWAENVPADLPVRAGPPYEDGRFGSIEDVDLTTQRLVVVSTGGSRTCPGWVRGVTQGRAGRTDVRVGTHRQPPGCTSDFHRFRSVLAVDADRLPTQAELGNGAVALLNASGDAGDRVLVVPYPYTRP